MYIFMLSIIFTRILRSRWCVSSQYTWKLLYNPYNNMLFVAHKSIQYLSYSEILEE